MCWMGQLIVRLFIGGNFTLGANWQPYWELHPIRDGWDFSSDLLPQEPFWVHCVPNGHFTWQGTAIGNAVNWKRLQLRVYMYFYFTNCCQRLQLMVYIIVANRGLGGG
jgi:hypothetical protein